MKKSLKRIIIVCLIACFSLFMLTSCVIEVFSSNEKQYGGDVVSSSAQVESAGSESADATNSGNTTASTTDVATASASTTTSTASTTSTSTSTSTATTTSTSTSTPTVTTTSTSTSASTSTPTATTTSTSTATSTPTVVGNVAFSYLGDDYGEHITSSEQFAAFFQYAALYKINKISLYLDFLDKPITNEQLNSAINAATDTITISYSFKDLNITSENTNQDLPFRISFASWADYDPNKTTKTSNRDDCCMPIDNLIAVRSKPDNKRANDFNDFKINSIAKSAPVKTSEQLFFVVMNGVKPVPTENSVAETIYNKAKAVLRDIVDDTMTDVEKVIAISDWLSKNVTYDHYLLQLLASGVDDARYNAHYLEGVFNDNRAVCDGFSKAFVLLTRIEGIESIMIEGKANGGGHAWNKVNLPKDNVSHWYVIDNTWNNSGLKADFNPSIPEKENYELWTRAYMLVTDKDIMATHTEDAGRNYPVATGGNADVDVYSSIVYGYDGNDPLTLKITSDTELEKLLRWTKAKLDTIDTESVKFVMLDMKVTYDYGVDFSSEVSRINGAKAIGLNIISKVRFGEKMGIQYLMFLL